MKDFRSYYDKNFSQLLKEVGGFFAFNEDQIKKGIKPGKNYTRFSGMGLFIEREYADTFLDRLEALTSAAIANDKKHNTDEEIIDRELINHEAWYTGTISDTVDALSGYGYTKEQIKTVHRAGYRKHKDWI
jgi:hypothetical protein